MAKMVVVLKGGMIQNIISDSGDLDITVIDHDTEGADPDEVKEVLGDDAFVSNAAVEVNPEELNAILDSLKNEPVMKCNMCHDGDMFHQLLLYSSKDHDVFVAESFKAINSIRESMLKGYPNHEGRRIVHIYNCDNCPNSQLEYHFAEDAIAYELAMNSKNARSI